MACQSITTFKKSAGPNNQQIRKINIFCNLEDSVVGSQLKECAEGTHTGLQYGRKLNEMKPLWNLFSLVCKSSKRLPEVILNKALTVAGNGKKF